MERGKRCEIGQEGQGMEGGRCEIGQEGQGMKGGVRQDRKGRG